MGYELLLNLAYIALAVGLVMWVHRLSVMGVISGGFSFDGVSDPLSAAFLGLFAITFFFLVMFVGTMPPIVIHQLAGNGWVLPHKHAQILNIGPLGNLAQIVGAGAAVFLLFRATWVVVVISGIGALVINHYHI